MTTSKTFRSFSSLTTRMRTRIRSLPTQSTLSTRIEKSQQRQQESIQHFHRRPHAMPFHTTTIHANSSSDGTNKDNDTHVRPDIAFIQQHYRIHRREKEGTNGLAREYLLLPPDVYVPQVVKDPSLPAAALFAHRNVLFGARSFHGYPMEDVCLPLVKAAIEESEALEPGHQPQAVANLKGLSEWVAICFENNFQGSETLIRWAEQKSAASDSNNDISAEVAIEAAKAIATGVPRPGHSVVGQGTFRDGQDLWKELAHEYVVTVGGSAEANLYQQQGGNLVGIEHLADTSPANMKAAGGAIARFYFL